MTTVYMYLCIVKCIVLVYVVWCCFWNKTINYKKLYNRIYGLQVKCKNMVMRFQSPLVYVFVAVFFGCTSAGRVGLCFLWFFVQELPKAQPVVFLVLKRLRRRDNGLKSHPTDWEKPGIEPPTSSICMWKTAFIQIRVCYWKYIFFFLN